MRSYIYQCMLLFTVLLVITLQSAHGISDEMKAKMKEDFMPKMMACVEEQKLDVEAVKAYKDLKELKDETSACFFACIFKKSGLLDQKGMYSENAALEKAMKFADNDEEKAKYTAAGKVCSKVNGEAVSDGDKGCDRAKLLYACLRTEYEKLGVPAPEKM